MSLDPPPRFEFFPGRNNYTSGYISRRPFRCAVCGKYRSWRTSVVTMSIGVWGYEKRLGLVCTTCQHRLWDSGACVQVGFYKEVYVLPEYRTILKARTPRGGGGEEMSESIAEERNGIEVFASQNAKKCEKTWAKIRKNKKKLDKAIAKMTKLFNELMEEHCIVVGHEDGHAVKGSLVLVYEPALMQNVLFVDEDGDNPQMMDIGEVSEAIDEDGH